MDLIAHHYHHLRHLRLDLTSSRHKSFRSLHVIACLSAYSMVTLSATIFMGNKCWIKFIDSFLIWMTIKLRVSLIKVLWFSWRVKTCLLRIYFMTQYFSKVYYFLSLLSTKQKFWLVIYKLSVKIIKTLNKKTIKS